MKASMTLFLQRIGYQELMLRNHVQVQTSWLAEACEQLTGTLPVLLQR